MKILVTPRDNPLAAAPVSTADFGIQELDGMTQQETVELICNIYNELAPPLEGSPSVDESTRLFGGALDSVGVVSLIVELEEQIEERCDVSITIADDLAMSQQRSPFRTIGSLADYIQGLMTKRAEA